MMEGVEPALLVRRPRHVVRISTINADFTCRRFERRNDIQRGDSTGPEVRRGTFLIGDITPRTEAHHTDRVTEVISFRLLIVMRQHKVNPKPMLALEDTLAGHADMVHPMLTLPAVLPETESPSAVRDQRSLRREFEKALASNDLSLRFVPRYRIASSRLTAADVVIRWQHRRRGVIPETLLIGLAEKVGIAREVTQWAIIEASLVLARLPTTMRFSLNVTPYQLARPGLVDSLHIAMDRFGILPEQLELSISEKALSRLDEPALLVLATLFDDGLSIALSHFGATYGSLNLLARIPLDCVKLDASLVRGVPHDPSSIAMIRAVTDVAHSMRARVVAQGVETEDQREILAKLRCDELQGGIASPALTAKDLERTVR